VGVKGFLDNVYHQDPRKKFKGTILFFFLNKPGENLSVLKFVFRFSPSAQIFIYKRLLISSSRKYFNNHEL